MAQLTPGNFCANSYARLICERKRERGVSNGHRMREGSNCRTHVILLQRLLRGRLGIGQRDERVGLAGRGERVRVDGRDVGADGDGEAALDVLQPMGWRNGVSKGEGRNNAERSARTSSSGGRST